LHVLGTPPAFVLSQDQTLQTKIRKSVTRTFKNCFEMYANICNFLFGRTDYGTLLWCSHHSSVVKVQRPFVASLRSPGFGAQRTNYTKRFGRCQGDLFRFVAPPGPKNRRIPHRLEKQFQHSVMLYCCASRYGAPGARFLTHPGLAWILYEMHFPMSRVF
jgi:hypothetical protein